MKRKKFCVSLTILTAIAAGAAAPAAASFRDAPDDLRALVDRHATIHGLPRAVARAVVQAESGWNPRTTGAAGEIGLMQIKHETARGLGYDGSREQLYEPETNVKWGMIYLAGAWKLGEGDLCRALLRYQAGHGAKSMTAASRAYCARVQRLMASTG